MADLMKSAAPYLKTAAPYIDAVTSAYTSYSQLTAGDAANQEARQRAADERAQANAVQVTAQGEAHNRRRRAELLASRARAVAGASGSGASDPTVNNIVADINAGGEYDAASALYSGDFVAEGLRANAAASEREGRAAVSSSRLRAAGTIFSSLTGFAEKYGDRKDSQYIDPVVVTARRRTL